MEESHLEACQTEVEELHRFFEMWFRGELEETDAVFERFAGVLAPEFEIITPGGMRLERKEILDRVREAHGAHRGATPPYRIWIQHPRSRQTTDRVCVMTYEEWQESSGEKRGRLSTAVFRTRDDTPNGIEWAHVHEVWLPNPEDH